MSTIGGKGAVSPPSNRVRRLFDRRLSSYPETLPRTVYLTITVVATIALYYELFVQGAVATRIIQHFGFTFTEFVFVGVIGGAVGAFASLGAGVADRWGRANLVVGGLLMAGLLVTFGLPNASSKAEYTIFFALLSMVEGVALVATPALIRDFSPQLGRAVAMAFWTMGPVIGSLVVTEVSSHTLKSHPDWRYQFYICGIVGLVVWAIALAGLRELSPRLRDQLMVSSRDRALIEARAAGIDPDKLLEGHWRQMLRFDIVGSAFGISTFLLLTSSLGLLVVYFGTVFGYSQGRANDLGNWYWITNVIALLAAGLLSDRLRVRKPFMVIGAAISAVGVALFAAAATKPQTGFHTFVAYFILMSAGSGIAYATWMAGFSETVEKHNPAATATGLAVWGWMLRIVFTAGFAFLTVVVPATNTVVNQGPRVKQIVRTYPAQARVLQTIDPATLAALHRNPSNPLAQARAISELSRLSLAKVATTAALSGRYAAELATAAAIDAATKLALAANPANTATVHRAVIEVAARFTIPPAQALARVLAIGKVPPAQLLFLQANGPKVQQAAARLKSVSTVPPADLAYLHANAANVAKALKDNPGQWQAWWWVCFAAKLVFIPLVFLLSGRWSPRKAREDEFEHDRIVQQEMATLRSSNALSR